MAGGHGLSARAPPTSPPEHGDDGRNAQPTARMKHKNLLDFPLRQFEPTYLPIPSIGAFGNSCRRIFPAGFSRNEGALSLYPL
jgi:hypothetical protein